MRKNVNQLKAGILLSYTSKFIRLITGMLYTPLMIRLLGQSDFGLYNIAASLVAYLGILNFGFGSAYLRYYSKYKVQEESEEKSSRIANLNGMFLVIFAVLGLVAIIAGLVLVFKVDIIFGSKLNPSETRKAQILMLILLFNLAFSFPNIVFSTYIQANEKFVLFYSLDIVRQVTTPLVNLPILLMGYGSIGMVTGTMLVNLVIELYTCIYSLKKMNMQIKFNSFDKDLFREMSVYSFYVFINIIIDQINNNVDKTILGKYQGTVSVAIYSVGNNLKLYFQEISTSIANVFTPRIHKMVSEGCSDDELTDIFTKVGRIQFVALSFVLMGFNFWGERFIYIWVGKGYRNSYYVALILMFTVTIALIQNVGIEIQRAKDKHRFRSWVYFFMALGNILLSIPMSKRYGELGTTVATGISFVIGNGFIMNWYYNKYIGINIKHFFMEIFNIIPSLLIPLIYSLVVNYIGTEKLISYLLSGCIFVIIYGASVWKWGLNKDEKRMIKVRR